MRHPDGEIPFFNDAAFGIAATPAQIDAYALRLGWASAGTGPSSGATFLEASGYGRLGAGPATLLVDVAPIGPDCLPGHAHADTLSFELSVGPERWIVNGGTSVYGRSKERQRQRSTAEHSTVVMDGIDSSEVWSGFRVGRRARVTSARLWQTQDAMFASGAHDGYRRLAGSPVHRRTWTLCPTSLCITDEITGGGAHRIEIYLPLAPGLAPELTADGTITISLRGTQVGRVHFAPATQSEAVLERCCWHPGFGESVPNWRIRRHISAELPLVLQTWIKWC